MSLRKKDEPPRELEEQFVLRLPPEQAYALRKIIYTRGVPLKDKLKIDFSSDGHHAVVQVEDVTLSAKLVDLPCAIGSMETVDRKTFYQTADISQMLVCSAAAGSGSPPFPEEPVASVDPLATEDNKKKDKIYMWKHGITPPLKNVRKKRFQKITKKFPDTKIDKISSGEYIDPPDVEKEVKRLLCSDGEATSIRWEVIRDEETMEIESQGCIPGFLITPQMSDPTSSEHAMFGEKINDSGSNYHDDDMEAKNDEEDEDSDEKKDDDDDDNEEEEEEEEQQERKSSEEDLLERELHAKFTEFSLCDTYEPGSSMITVIEKLIEYKEKRLQGVRRKAQRQKDLLRDLTNPTLTSHFQSVLGQLIIKEIQLCERIYYLQEQLKYFVRE
uniref:TAFII55 protein conserved region domain-containing protein n=1 Tax=Nannospalax galili TaxID=1026970 RepID=A0A8C6RSF7_NANGA